MAGRSKVIKRRSRGKQTVGTHSVGEVPKSILYVNTED
jgi:hypothetical protein